LARADQIIEVRDYIRVHAGTTAMTLDGDDLRRFNRRLLEDAYPDGLEGLYRLRTEAIIRKLHATPRAVLCLSPHGTRPRRDLTTNRTLVRQRDAEQAILETIEHDLLRPDVLDAAIGRVLDQLDAEATARETTRLEVEMSRLDGELRRLADVIASTGGDVQSLMTAIREREGERVRVQGRLTELAATSQVARMDRVRLARDLRARLTFRLG
jgi:hypothetical protein